jgi:hypothetical protein
MGTTFGLHNFLFPDPGLYPLSSFFFNFLVYVIHVNIGGRTWRDSSVKINFGKNCPKFWDSFFFFFYQGFKPRDSTPVWFLFQMLIAILMHQQKESCGQQGALYRPVAVVFLTCRGFSASLVPGIDHASGKP